MLMHWLMVAFMSYESVNPYNGKLLKEVQGNNWAAA
jgi:hypothetical protein